MTKKLTIILSTIVAVLIIQTAIIAISVGVLPDSPRTFDRGEIALIVVFMYMDWIAAAVAACIMVVVVAARKYRLVEA